MIELLISQKFDNRLAFVWISRILLWLTDSIKDDESILLEGYMAIRDEPKHVSVLLICDGESLKKIIKILQQPPEELKDKYIATVTLEDTKLSVCERIDDSCQEEEKGDAEEMKDEKEKPS